MPSYQNLHIVTWDVDTVPIFAICFVIIWQGSRQNQSDVFKVSAQLNEVATKKSSNSAAVPKAKSEESAKESPAQSSVPDVSSISAFMTQVAHVVKLVDSGDIMELQLKQLDCELVIRKKEALHVAAPVVMMQPNSAQAMVPSQFPQVQVSAPDPSPPASAPVSPSPAKPKSSRSPLKCPMAGTFYRCPAPGAPRFVKENVYCFQLCMHALACMLVLGWVYMCVCVR
ncbi:hypothetical protein HYC85_016641 [Camellia sinensis]|uniref:Uncharacterized protein n=1 Tax=Camellia sinensis TaxID=4442 RepID=A0A7J7H075_CAMSI|nr:hypothetical protein HYC85_016641 [Camellia sinensis]